MPNYTDMDENVIDSLGLETPASEDDEEIDVNGIEVVVDRVTHGLIGSLAIKSSINKPILKEGDIAHLKTANRLQIGDFVLYSSHGEYFLRRIIKFKDLNIYVAGDTEKEYHIIHKEDVIAKVVARERGKKYQSFGLKKESKFYTFRKVNLAYFRLKDRVLDYDDDINIQAFENALQNQEQTAVEEKQEYKYDFDLDTILSDFLNPDDLVIQLQKEEEEAEEIIYVDEFGNPIDPNEISEEDEVSDYEEPEDSDEETDVEEDVYEGTFEGEEDMEDPDALKDEKKEEKKEDNSEKSDESESTDEVNDDKVE